MTQLDFTQAKESTTFDYENVRAYIAYTSGQNYNTSKGHLFRVQEHYPVFDLFLNSLDQSERQHYSCNTCRQFLNRWGNVVYVDPTTLEIRSLLFSGMTNNPVLKSLENWVTDRPIIEAVNAKEAILGHEHLGGWSHFYGKVDVSRHAKYRRPVADIKQEYQMLARYLNSVSNANINTLQTIIDESMLGMYSSQYKHMVAWLVEVANSYQTLPRPLAANKLWLAVSTAPNGYAHVKNTVIGQVLDMMSNNVSLERIKAHFGKMTDRRNYQRPKAAPSKGNIVEANKIVAELGLEPSFERRFATVEEISQYALWLPNRVQVHPATVQNAQNGFFDRLQANSDYTLDAHVATTQTVSMAYFIEQVLPKSQTVLYVIRPRDNYKAMVTAVHPDSLPIIKWDLEHARNPVSWYVKSEASPSADWSLFTGNAVEVTGAFNMPFMWGSGSGDKWPSFKDSHILTLAGCKDQQANGLALFPEILKPELRGIRGTIEAYSNQGEITDKHGPYTNLASGLSISQATIGNGYTFMVKSASGIESRYVIKSLV